MHGLTDAEWRDLVLSVNVHRKQRRLSPARVASYLDRALCNVSVEQLAISLGFGDTTTLRKIHRLHKLPADLAAVVDWGNRRGNLSMTTASELMRLDSESLVREAFTGAIEHDLTREEARQVVQSRQRSGSSILECIARALATRPRIERSELILGSFVTAKAQRIAEALGNEAAAHRLKIEIARHLPRVVPKALRVNDGRFSLLLSEDAANELRAGLSGKSIEDGLSTLLERVRSD